jgi:hypothetical protein
MALILASQRGAFAAAAKRWRMGLENLSSHLRHSDWDANVIAQLLRDSFNLLSKILAIDDTSAGSSRCPGTTIPMVTVGKYCMPPPTAA